MSIFALKNSIVPTVRSNYTLSEDVPDYANPQTEASHIHAETDENGLPISLANLRKEMLIAFV